MPSKDAQELKTLIYSRSLLSSRKEPIYLFTDTIDTKLIVFNLCQTGNFQRLNKSQEKNYEVVDTERKESEVKQFDFSSLTDIVKFRKSKQEERGAIVLHLPIEPEEALQPRTFAWFILEKFKWDRNKLGHPEVILNTFGTKSALVNFGEGRFTFRLWIYSETPFVLNVLSDVHVAVGSFELLLENMAMESQCLTNMCYDISSSFVKLVTNFGTPDYRQCLRTFYSSYKPRGCELTKLQANEVHESFLQQILMVLKDNFTVDDFNNCTLALRVLFLNPYIKQDIKMLSQTSRIEVDIVSINSEDTLILKEIERAATVIQSFFRTIYVQSIIRMQKESHKKHAIILAALKKIYTCVFGAQQRMHTCPLILRNILFDLPYLVHPLKRDIRSVIHLQSLTGQAAAIPQATWIPVCRCIFQVNSLDPVNVGVYLFCELANYMVRVFDNDTGNEIRR